MASVRRFDPERAKRAAARVDRNWALIAEKGTGHFLAGLDDQRPWEERTIGDVYAAKVAELVGADKRAKRLSEAPRVSALILMQGRIADKGEWEQFAADEAIAAERERKAIDAVPQEEVQRGAGERGVSIELVAGVPEGPAK